MGWKGVKKFFRWGGAVFGFVEATVWVREMLTRTDRDIFVEMFGSVVSLHSLYLGAAVGGGVLTMACAWPVVGWGVGIYKRRAQKRESQRPPNRFRRLHEIIVREFNLIEQDRQFRSSANRRSQPSKYAQRAVLSFELSNLGIETPSPACDDDDRAWYDFVTNLVPLAGHARLEEARSLWLKLSDETGENRDR